jgi:RNA recognition motif-containing protein
MNIFVGNLAFNVKENDLKKVFQRFGNVATAEIVMNKKGHKSRGFAFVEMLDEQEAQNAITALDGKDFMGRNINVSPALSTTEINRENKVQSNSPKIKEQRGFRVTKPFKKTNAYKQGRRSRSFMKRKTASGIK